MLDIKLNTPEKAVVYARYSSHSQGEQSIEGQLAAAKKYAADKNYTIIREYVDRAMTGRNDNREAFQKMLADCAKHQFSVIIVWKVDRFGRNREEITINKYRAKKHGVRVEYIAESLGSGPESVILESVLEGMAEYYSLQLSQNIARGRRESAKKHQVLGPLPLGYTTGEDRLFVVDPETAPIVRRIFADYVSGKTMAEICSELNAEGLTTRRGKRFNFNTLRKILHNEKYIGIYDYNNGEIRDEDAIPAILDKETFYAAQEISKQNLRRKVKESERQSDYLLSGKLFCGECGGMMVGESGTSHTGAVHNYYSCQNHKKRRGCKQHAIRQDETEAAVLRALLELLNDNVLEEIADAAWQYYEQEHKTEDRVSAIAAELEKAEVATRNIVRAIEAGAYSDVLNDRLKELAEQKASLQDALELARQENELKLTKDHILFFLLRLRDGDVTDPLVQKRLIQTFVNSIFYYSDDGDDGKLVVNVNCTGEEKTLTLKEMQAQGPVRADSTMLHFLLPQMPSGI